MDVQIIENRIPLKIVDDDPIHFGTSEYINTKLIDRDIYEGPYVVTPAVELQQVLETDGKIMKDDVVVEEIPTYLTQNEKGMTFIIGD